MIMTKMMIIMMVVTMMMMATKMTMTPTLQRYPESWRGTACSLPRTGYLLPTLSSYRLLAS